MGPDNLAEWETRRQRIDVWLGAASWNPKDLTQVVQEVDTKQSDFSRRDYKTVRDTLHLSDTLDRAYADYLLLDSSGFPLAVVEAKKTSRSAILGQKQAEGYADDIGKKTGMDVFIFLTNGHEIWFWNRPHENPRMVKGFHSRGALERVRFQNKNRRNFDEIPIKREIIDRPYQLEAVKRIVEGIDRGRRRFLIVQATGTGKTRVAMALIDVLLRANRAQRVLFLADRRALRDQAYTEGFKTFFPNESKTIVLSSNIEKSSRLYASTIQTFMECYEGFSVGDFDVIISDECHRSIYNKWKDVFTYFDAVKIGLTATPSELIERDTFRFFECDDRAPTSLYTYDEAVQDGWLAPFSAHKTQTHFQIAGISPGDVPREVARGLLEKGVDPEDIDFDGTEIEKKVVVIGTNEAIVREFMDNCLMDITGTVPAKTIFFAITKQHAKRLWEAFERMYPEYRGKLARIIVSEDSRAQDLLREFKHEEWPKVAISVDMLDTGVNVPEVCNLVFAKPVFSKIRFWQMIGRGTRSDQTCKHKAWLPDGKKEMFLVFDCWNVFDWFDMHPNGVESTASRSIPEKIFLERLRQLKLLREAGNGINEQKVVKKVLDDIDSLPSDSIAVRESAENVELALSPRLWDRVGLDPIEFLKTKIAPLMRYRTDVGQFEASFLYKCEQLTTAILEGKNVQVVALGNEIGRTLSSLPMTIDEVKKKEQLLDRVLAKSFWNNPTCEDVGLITDNFVSLMKYRRVEVRPPVVLDIDDVMEKREVIEYGPASAPLSDFISSYKKKVDSRIKQLANEHPTIRKIKLGEVITDSDLAELEQTLNSPDLYISEETLQTTYGQQKATLIQFIKMILGLYEFPDAKKQIEEAFKTFMIERSYLNSDQINFLRTMQTVFTKKHHIEYADLFEPPFTSFGPNAPLPLLHKEDLTEAIAMCDNLEKEVFVDA